MRIRSLLKQDIIFQFRHRFYYAYFFIIAVYFSILMNVEGVIKEFLTVIILFSDTTVLGFFFVGGLLLLERDQNILQSLFVTPIKLYEYLFSKAFSLTILAMAASFLVAFSAFGIPKNLFFFSAGVVLSSTFFIFTGISIAVRSKTVNRYFFNAIVFTMLLFAPLLDLFGILRSRFFLLFPTHGSILLFKTLFEEVSLFDMAASTVSLIVWNVAIITVAYRWFVKYEILKNTKN